MAENGDETFMKLALAQAALGIGRTSPNPAVGAVVVKAGKVVGQGCHRGAGRPHAEIEALKSASRSVTGTTLYVTLEPCCHTGRTGPCTAAIIEAGIARVVYALRDPNPLVNGKGAARLSKAGIQVSSGVLASEARAINRPYFHFLSTGQPLVTVKSALSLDGRIATLTGDSQWITGRAARAEGHRLRAESDVVVVGGETCRVDNPALTVRHVRGKNPHRLVVTSSGKIDPKCRVISENAAYTTIIATSPQGAKRLGAIARRQRFILWEIQTIRNGLLNLSHLLNCAIEFGFRSILVEGGGQLVTSFWKAGLVDRFVGFYAPVIIGEGKSMIGDLRIRSLSERIVLRNVSVATVGSDIMISGDPEWKGR